MNIYPILYEKHEIFIEEEMMTGRGILQHGKYTSQSSTRGAKSLVVTIYIHMKRLNRKRIELGNYGGWLSKCEVNRTNKQERKILSRDGAHRHSPKACCP